MARPLRINVAGGWYHITARGNNRQEIFYDKRDREHFLELLEEMGGRYAVRIHAYAGYEAKPSWLDSAVLLRRVRGGGAGYRRQSERRLCGVAKESVWSRLKWGAVLGSERFAATVRDGMRPHRETAGRRVLQRRQTFEEVVRIVEEMKGEKWDEFRDRRGDWGRDLALWAARRGCGLTLGELGEQAGNMDYAAVAMAIRRFEGRARQNQFLRTLQERVTGGM